MGGRATPGPRAAASGLSLSARGLGGPVGLGAGSALLLTGSITPLEEEWVVLLEWVVLERESAPMEAVDLASVVTLAVALPSLSLALPTASLAAAIHSGGQAHCEAVSFTMMWGLLLSLLSLFRLAELVLGAARCLADG